ncbi:hypothetical protein ACFQX4_00470 [Roseomonas sp. GCM10028921]
MDSIRAAAGLLAAARDGAALPGLPQALRPITLDAAEAIQHATFAALGERIGGWKLGRQLGHVFSAPIPASRILADPGEAPVPMPAARFIELEVALRFHGDVAPAAAAALRPEDLPGLARLATLFELVQPRFEPSAEPGPLDRIAECVGNHGAALRESPQPWSFEELDAPPPVRLLQDGRAIAERDGPHVAAPLRPLFEAWIARLGREGRGIAVGEVVTFGSLTGMPPVPPEGALYRGEIGGMGPLLLTVAPA